MNRYTVALAVVLAVGTAGCDNPLGVDGGKVRFVLSSAPDAPAPAVVAEAGSQPASTDGISPDGPALHGDFEGEQHNPFFASANVTFTSILARNLDGVLVNIDMDLPTTVDVVAMESGRQIVLPDGNLPAATYDQIVVVMTQVQGVTHDGTTVTITPPGGGWTAIVPICPFVVEDGGTAVVGLALSVRRSFFWRDNRFHFQPRFVCEQVEGESNDG